MNGLVGFQNVAVVRIEPAVADSRAHRRCASGREPARKIRSRRYSDAAPATRHWSRAPAPARARVPDVGTRGRWYPSTARPARPRPRGSDIRFRRTPGAGARRCGRCRPDSRSPPAPSGTYRIASTSQTSSPAIGNTRLRFDDATSVALADVRLRTVDERRLRTLHDSATARPAASTCQLRSSAGACAIVAAECDARVLQPEEGDHVVLIDAVARTHRYRRSAWCRDRSAHSPGRSGCRCNAWIGTGAGADLADVRPTAEHEDDVLHDRVVDQVDTAARSKTRSIRPVVC